MTVPNETVRMIVAGTLNPPEVGSREYDEWYADAIAAARSKCYYNDPETHRLTGYYDDGYSACAAVLVSLGLAR